MDLGNDVELARVSQRSGRNQALTWRHATGAMRGSLLAFLLGVGTGCYSFPNVVAVPQAGTRVVLELNDRGRVGMGESIGPAATRIEGVVQSVPDSAYPLRVVSVDYSNGQSNKWNGEPLTVSRNFISTVKQRQFSKSRTFLFAASVAAVALGFALTRGIIGHGSPDPDESGGGKPGPAS